MTPTALTLRLLRADGFLAAVVESWIPHLNQRRDLFGGFDVIGVHPVDRSIVLVQCTTTGNLSARVRKLQGLTATPILLRAGILCEAWGWRKADGKWTVRRVALKGEACQPVDLDRRRPRRPKAMKQGSLFE